MLEESSGELGSGPALPSHVYVHVPFCRSKCSYCDFVSTAGVDEPTVLAVFEAMRSEVRRWGASSLPGVVETIYVGGGTPSFVAGEVARLIRFARAQLPVRGDVEVTAEANPDSFDSATADVLASAGINRLSLGVQSFDDSVLRILGRLHDADRAWEAASAAIERGLELSVDLMCGVPGQSIASWSETVDRAIRCGAHHVSVYPLTLEEGTPLCVAVGGGLVPEIDSDETASMMLLAEDLLQRAGLVRYEVANYALPGRESRHNTAYWTGDAYLGIGPGAHGMLDTVTAYAAGVLERREQTPEAAKIGRVRYRNTGDTDAWLFGEQWEIETLTTAETLRENVMLGLRMKRGVSARMVASAGLDSVLASLERDGLTELVGDRWRTTKRGWLLGNEVFGRVWTAE